MHQAKISGSAKRLDDAVKAIVNGGFLDPLDANGLLAMAQEIDPAATVEHSFDGYLHFAFSDGSTVVYDDETEV